MGKYEGIEDLLKVNVDIELENHKIVEGEISEYASFLYDITTNEYLIESDEIAESEEYDDTQILIDDSFEGLSIGKCNVTKKDFEDFKNFIKQLKEKGEI